MKILLLGAKGNLGTQIAKQCQKEDKLILWESDNLDLEDPEGLIDKIIALKPDVVINTVAYNAVDKCETDNSEYELAKILNINLPQILAQACLVSDSALLHYSSDYVFGAYEDQAKIDEVKEQGGFKEDDLPKTNCKYAKTKFSGEKAIQSYSKDKLKYYIIRTSKLFGPKGDSPFTKPSFFDIMLGLAKKQKSIKVVDDEMSCFTYTPDLARTSLDIVATNKPFGVYHVVNEGDDTWYSATKTLFELAGVKVDLKAVGVDEFPRPAKRPKYSALQNSKLPKLRAYQEALQEYLKSIM